MGRHQDNDELDLVGSLLNAVPRLARQHIHVGVLMAVEGYDGNELASQWSKDFVQFPRLLCEIVATQNVNLSLLAESMDLSVVEVNELFDRANIAWERHKGKI